MNLLSPNLHIKFKFATNINSRVHYAKGTLLLTVYVFKVSEISFTVLIPLSIKINQFFIF